MRTSTAQTWLTLPSPRPHAPVRLYCFPYAGAGPSMFRDWVLAAPSDLELCLVHLPGRERRIADPPYSRMTALVETLGPMIANERASRLAFFGHSVGAHVAFHLARWLEERGSPAPSQLFLSGALPPHLRPKRELHQLPDREFVATLRSFTGTPEEVLQHEELMTLLLPSLRADFALLETAPVPSGAVSAPVHVFGGRDDPEVPLDGIEQWRQHTNGHFGLTTYEGSHFFVRERGREILQECGAILVR